MTRAGRASTLGDRETAGAAEGTGAAGPRRQAYSPLAVATAPNPRATHRVRRRTTDLIWGLRSQAGRGPSSVRAANRRASARSKALLKRWEGSFARQTRRIRPRGEGGRSEPAGPSGRPSRITRMVSSGAARRKGWPPVVISHRITPRLKRSLRASTAWPCTCSGLM